MPLWTERFAVEAAVSGDAHRSLPGEVDLEAVFAETEGAWWRPTGSGDYAGRKGGHDHTTEGKAWSRRADRAASPDGGVSSVPYVVPQ